MEEKFITVYLRVVGIQFYQAIQVPARADGTANIRGLMEAARKQNNFDFDYSTAPDGTLYRASFILREGKHSVSSGLLYKPGLYELSDNVASETSVTTWQYYVIRGGEYKGETPSGRPKIEGGTQINHPDGRVEPFSLEEETPEAIAAAAAAQAKRAEQTAAGESPTKAEQFGSPKLQDGDVIIWRLVVVAVKPTIRIGETNQKSKVDRLPTETNAPSV